MTEVWWKSPQGKRFKKAVRDLVKFRNSSAIVVFPWEDMKDGRNSWDGETLAPYVRYPEGYLHDVAHLLVSSTRRLSLVNFGLGADPAEGGCETSKRTVTMEHAQREENLTCYLQFALCALLKLDMSEIITEVDYLSCKFTNEEDLQAVKKYRPEALSPENWSKVEAARKRFASTLEKKGINT